MPNTPPAEIETPPRLLQDVRVLDLTHYISGPYCTKLMATMGAEVVKVERRGTGDPIRQFGPFAISRPFIESTGRGTAWSEERLKLESGAWFLYLNTSKKSLTLELKSDEGRNILGQLARSSHVLVENFAPGTMDRLDLGPSHLQKLNSGLVMTSISNYGQTGPHRDWKAAEINLYAAGGLMNITGEPDREPLMEGAPLAQLGAGQNAFVASMAALMYAEETGEGQHIDVSIAEYATNILENALMQYSYSGQEFTRVGNWGYGRAAWGIYPCRDGYVGIIAGPDHRWPEMAAVMEREELADPRFGSRNGRMMHADEVDALMLPWLLEHDKVDIFKAGQDHGFGFAYVATMEDILEMEQLVSRNFFMELNHPVAGNLKYPGPPMNHISSPSPDIDPWVYRRAPLLGEHTREILDDLGYSEDEVEVLRNCGVI